MFVAAAIVHKILPHLLTFLAGVASWYGTAFGAHGCAMTALPRGTTVYIQNLQTQRWSWCRVNDYGPERSLHRLIDVSPHIAHELGFPLSQGLTHVRVYVRR